MSLLVVRSVAGAPHSMAYKSPVLSGTIHHGRNRRSHHSTLWKTLDLIYDQIRLADAKAGSILFIDGGVATIISTRLVDAHSFLRGNYILVGVAVIGALFWLSSVYFAIQAVRPRLGNQAPSSLIYFGDIARMYPGDFRQYEQAVQRGMASEDQIMDRISEQIWSNARVAVKRHRNARMSMDCLVATVVVTLVAGLVFFVRGLV